MPDDRRARGGSFSVIVQHSLEARTLERLNVVGTRLVVLNPPSEPIGGQLLVGVRLLKSSRVGAVFPLIRVVGQLASETDRMWQIQYHEPVNDVRLKHRHRPSDHAAPVVPNYDCLLLALTANDGDNILPEQFHSVVVNAIGLVAQVVTTLINRNDAIAFCERFHLVAPGIPIVRKTVNHHHQRPLAYGRVMDTHVSTIGIAVRNIIEQAHPYILFARGRNIVGHYPKRRMGRLALALGLLAEGCGENTADPIDATHPPTEILGELDPLLVGEASGLAISRQFPDRLYHHNDSGGGPYFYLTSFSGEHTQKIEIEGFDDSGQDLEDMA